MALNKDGLEVGQTVSFEELRKVENERKNRKPSTRSTSKKKVSISDKQSDESTLKPTSKKKA